MTASTEPRGGLEYGWDPGEDGWGPSMNANLLRLSRVGFHPSVVSKSTTSPPGSPVSGEGYIVPSGATGAWSGQSGKIAIWDGAAWVYIMPRDGFLVHVADADGLALYDGGAWSADVLRSDRLATAYDHSQTSGNPHGTTAAQVGAAPTVHIHLANDITVGTFDEARIPALPMSRITGLDTALAGKSGVGHTHSFTAADVGAFPWRFATGGVDASSLSEHGVYSLRVAGGSNWWVGLGGTQNVALIQAHGADGLKSQIACDQRYGGLLTRSQMSEYGNAWSGWATIWDALSLPVGTKGRAVIAAATSAAARSAITAAKAVVMSTKSGNWTLDANTELGLRQTSSGTLTLPAASTTYAGLTYKITATTTLTLTISGSFVVLDAPTTASYWYTEATISTFNMQGGHADGARKTIELYCDGVEWFVKCV